MSDNASDSAALINRATAGDEQALAALFTKHRDRLRRMLDFRMDQRLRGRIDPSDVLQEAMLVAAQNVQQYVETPAFSFFVWLRQITMPRLIDVHRRHLGAQKRSARQEVRSVRQAWGQGTSVSLARYLVGQLSTPSQAVIRAELLDHVQKALDRMDKIDREVLALRHFEELTNNEVAEVLGLQKSAASNRYVRALTRLRTILSEVPGFFDDE